MTLPDTNKPLITQLEALYSSCKKAVGAETDPAKKKLKTAHANGVQAAFELAKQYEKLLEQQNNGPCETTSDTPTRLHEMTALDVYQISMEKPEKLEQYSKEDLTEAAFVFENEQMAILEDMNTIPYDSYNALPPVELIKIIKHAVEEICRIKNLS